MTKPVPLTCAASLLAALLVTAWCALAFPPAVAPPVVPATAEASSFSAERARRHLLELTREHRPIGSPGHARAREYLLAELRALGLQPELQQATGLRRFGTTVRAASVANIVARVPGTQSSGAVVLLSHYDSVPNAPGAADAGHGVAAILEALRALSSDPPLRNDLIVLITDAEETGLLGAQAYVDEHPWAADTGIVLNAEGRGHTGPVQMFRTTTGNGKMIRALARAAPHPAAESLANEILRLMPNDTDLSVFQHAGYAGMDFANAHGLTHYHTPLDSFENADPRTLQHHGDYLLSLARAFGAMDLADLAAPDRSYFALPALGLVHYPQSWGLALAALAAALTVAAAIGLHWHGALRTGRVGLGLLHLAGAVVLLPLLATAAWRLLAVLVPEVAWFEHGSPYDSGRYLLGIGLLATALYAGSAAWLRRWVQPAEMLVAALVCWSLLGLASAWWLPGASYLFLWPLLFAVAGLAAWQWAARRPAVLAVTLAVAALPTLLFLLPLIEGIEVALTLGRIAAPVALLVLGLGLLALQLEVLSRLLRWALPGLLATAGLAVLGVALLGGGFDEERRKPNSVHYLADLDAAEALWYSNDPLPDEWTRRFLGEDPERAELPDWAPTLLAGPDGRAWQRPAPVLRGEAPHAEMLADAPVGEGRRVHLRITAPAGSYFTVIRFPDGPELNKLQVDGREAPPATTDGTRQLIYFGLPEQGTELEFTTAAAGPLRIYLRANLLGLPPLEDGTEDERPGYMMPAGSLGDLTRLQRTLEF
jgi:hypothetical protein